MAKIRGLLKASHFGPTLIVTAPFLGSSLRIIGGKGRPM
jgi:hypothetical protein